MEPRPSLTNCFGRRPPKRVPTPPAGITTANFCAFGPSGITFLYIHRRASAGGAPAPRRPAARTASAEERGQGVADRGDAADVERHLHRLEDVVLRHDRPAKAESGCLAQAELEPGHRADLAGEPDLADHA